MSTENKKTYQCTVSMSYFADDPKDAAMQFIANIQANPNWYVSVLEFDENLKTVSKVVVDTETGETEE